jgi:uncharacterized membrane protein
VAEQHQAIIPTLRLVAAAPWVPATQVQASLATGRCPVLVALQLLVERQQQQVSQGIFGAVVPVRPCLGRDFRVVVVAVQLP